MKSLDNMSELEKEILRFYQENLSWALSEYEGDLKRETIEQMSLEWTVEDCIPLIKDIVKNYSENKFEKI